MSNNIFYDNIVVINTESTCWEDGKKPENEEQEIIEIGVCLLSVVTLQPHSVKQIIIKPERSKISEHCFELTGLSQEDVDCGISLSAACDVLRNTFKTKNRVWASYGEYDKKMFNSYCKQNAIEYPFNNRFINVKSMLPIVMGTMKEVNLANALEIIDSDEEYGQHCAVINVGNVARVLAETIRGGSAYGTKTNKLPKVTKRIK
jgi:inhibitor of KinA sporulation pathway (predicted exonuclease)